MFFDHYEKGCTVKKVVTNPIPIARFGVAPKKTSTQVRGRSPHGVMIPSGYQDCLRFVHDLYSDGQKKVAAGSHQNDNRKFTVTNPLYLFVPKGVPVAMAQTPESLSERYSDFIGYEQGDDGMRLALPSDTVLVAYHPCPSDRWPTVSKGALVSIHLPDVRHIVVIGDGGTVKVRSLTANK